MRLPELSTLALASISTRQNSTLPGEQIQGNISLTQTVGSIPLDGNYVSQFNSTAYEWWYFDAVADDLSASVVWQPILGDDDNARLRFSISLPDTTVLEYEIPYESMQFSTLGSGSSGTNLDGNWSWTSKPDLSQYTITLDMKDVGVSGTIVMNTLAPPHVACGLALPGARLDYNWDLYWLNAVPNSLASVDLLVNDTRLAFNGSGYHDKNWGPVNFFTDLNQWYWGHGTTGTHSVVWFYHIGLDGTVSSSGYISEQGKLLFSDCGDAVVVAPYGPGITVPLSANQTADQEGIHINIDAGKVGKFAFQSHKKQEVVTPSAYDRWIGKFSGGKVGEANGTGVALWEQMGPLPTT